MNSVLLLLFPMMCLFSFFKVIRVDGRMVGDGRIGPVTQRMQKAYMKFTAESGVPIPTYQEC